MKLVSNTPKYWEFIRNLRNLDGVREHFVKQEKISPVEQATYMLQYNNNYWICLVNEKAAGYIGVIKDDIRVATHPDFQGQGVGSFMINEVMKIIPNAMAKVKLDNAASLRLFENCGFKKKYYLLERDHD
tara:strand:+ start:384 stop:773 length:390 start_codon:yes stop_codon:yes gene_type:complete